MRGVFDSAALRVFPELAERFQTAADANRAIELSAIARKDALEVYQKGNASKFIGTDPTQAVASALRSKDPVRAFRQLSDLIAGDADAKAGLQRAVVELMDKRLVGNVAAGDTGTTFLKPDMIQRFVSENRPALSQIFSPDQPMDAIAADLQRAQRSVNSKLPGTPGTASDLTSAGRGHGFSNLLQYLIAEKLGGVLTGFGFVGDTPADAATSSGAPPGCARHVIRQPIPWGSPAAVTAQSVARRSAGGRPRPIVPSAAARIAIELVSPAVCCFHCFQNQRRSSWEQLGRRRC